MKLYLVTRSESGTEYNAFTDEDYDWQNQFVDQIFTDFNSAMKYYKKCIHYMNKYNKNEYSNPYRIDNYHIIQFNTTDLKSDANLPDPAISPSEKVKLYSKKGRSIVSVMKSEAMNSTEQESIQDQI